MVPDSLKSYFALIWTAGKIATCVLAFHTVKLLISLTPVIRKSLSPKGGKYWSQSLLYL